MSFCVQWGVNFSALHIILSGLLQGNLLSPKFFCIYVDSLLLKLEHANKGVNYLENLLVRLCMQMICCFCPVL